MCIKGEKASLRTPSYSFVLPRTPSYSLVLPSYFLRTSGVRKSRFFPLGLYTYKRGKDKTIELHREKPFEKYIILRSKFQHVMMSCVFRKSPTYPTLNYKAIR